MGIIRAGEEVVVVGVQCHVLFVVIFKLCKNIFVQSGFCWFTLI